MTGERRIMAGALCCALTLTGFVPALAHHSYSMFDLSKQSEVTGTVRNLEWTNPHVWLWVTVVDEKGAPANYAFEGTSFGEMSRRNGWTKRIISFGDKVTVKYRPFKDGKNGGRIQAVILADGRTLGADAVHRSSQTPTNPPHQ